MDIVMFFFFKRRRENKAFENRSETGNKGTECFVPFFFYKKNWFVEKKKLFTKLSFMFLTNLVLTRFLRLKQNESHFFKNVLTPVWESIIYFLMWNFEDQSPPISNFLI